MKLTDVNSWDNDEDDDKSDILYYDSKDTQHLRSQHYVDGYRDGYATGQSVTPEEASLPPYTSKGGDWSSGYAVGYNHGQEHKDPIKWVDTEEFYQP
jgi:hypothetical protein